MREFNITRPLSVERLTAFLVVKTFEVMRDLIYREMFLAPKEIILDDVAIDISKKLLVELK